MRDRCAVLDWAESGAMALTGMPGRMPVTSPAPALDLLGQVTAELARVTAGTGERVRADPAELITGRAALAGLTRGGQVSAGGSSFLLRSADGWCAVTLSRPDDVAAVPAIAGLLGWDSARWDSARWDRASLNGASLDGIATKAAARSALTVVARGTPAEDLAAAAQLAGVPAAALPATLLPTTGPPTTGPPTTGPPTTGPPTTGPPPAAGTAPAAVAGWPPWRAARIAAPLAGARLAGAVVADLSSMWAGPLCARLLGLAGAEVIKVESPARPDGARFGNGEFFDWLHAGHRSVSADFGTRAGRTVLAALLEAADVVIEASRPRALAALGLAPDMVPHRPGQVWLSITGYGRTAPGRVAFGDDAAVAGGLVGWTAGSTAGSAAGSTGVESSPEPVFCADAIADPLAGACGALAVALSRSAGGGELIDLSMRDVAAAFAAAALDHGPHDVLPSGSVACPRTGREQAIRPPRAPGPPGGALRPAARAAELGADTAAVLGWLAAGNAAC
jgi:crotonobetainyl-CoA:carnitine CoA-transferase CaiB-like acyl-CoA transferase